MEAWDITSYSDTVHSNDDMAEAQHGTRRERTEGQWRVHSWVSHGGQVCPGPLGRTATVDSQIPHESLRNTVDKQCPAQISKKYSGIFYSTYVYQHLRLL